MKQRGRSRTKVKLSVHGSAPLNLLTDLAVWHRVTEHKQVPWFLFNATSRPTQKSWCRNLWYLVMKSLFSLSIATCWDIALLLGCRKS